MASKQNRRRRDDDEEDQEDDEEEDGSDEEEDEEEEEDDETGLTGHGARSRRMKGKISDQEKELLAEKPWALRGEVHSHDRPQNRCPHASPHSRLPNIRSIRLVSISYSTV